VSAPGRPPPVVLQRPARPKGDVEAFRARKAAEHAACVHPAAGRAAKSWGSFCGRCGLLAGLVEQAGGWDRLP